MLTFVFGTRPEAHKIRSVLVALNESNTEASKWQGICTDQHTDLLGFLREDPVFSEVAHINCPSDGAPEEYVEDVVATLHQHVAGHAWPLCPGFESPTFVVVQGDTASALAGARWAAQLGVPLAHIEAGVRSGDLTDPWPEEGFRREITTLAEYHFCASRDNAITIFNEKPGSMPNSLLAAYLERDDPKVLGKAYLTGNPGLDGLADLPFASPLSHVLITLHRRESFGHKMQTMAQSLVKVAWEVPSRLFLWPVHPNPHVRDAIPQDLPPNLVLLPPLERPAFLSLLRTSHLVVTDSGGVQEESAFLGIPCVVARRVTDRPESVASGHALLAPNGDLSGAIREALVSGRLKASAFKGFGDGKSGKRIAGHLKRIVEGV